MSNTSLIRADDGSLYLTSYCGPVRPDGGVRTRFELARADDTNRQLDLSMGQLKALYERLKLRFEDGVYDAS